MGWYSRYSISEWLFGDLNCTKTFSLADRSVHGRRTHYGAAGLREGKEYWAAGYCECTSSFLATKIRYTAHQLLHRKLFVISQKNQRKHNRCIPLAVIVDEIDSKPDTGNARFHIPSSQVSDGLHPVRTFLSVSVLDDNDNPPVFSAPLYDFVFPHTLGRNSVIGETSRFPSFAVSWNDIDFSELGDVIHAFINEFCLFGYVSCIVDIEVIRNSRKYLDCIFIKKYSK